MADNIPSKHKPRLSGREMDISGRQLVGKLVAINGQSKDEVEAVPIKATIADYALLLFAAWVPAGIKIN